MSVYGIELPASVLHQSQTVRIFDAVEYVDEYGEQSRIQVTARYDDTCRNGHNTFALTADVDVYAHGTWRWSSGGCCHSAIAKYVPSLARYIPWHLCSSDGPMHYVENTCYHASDRDHWGSLKGEQRRSPKSGKLIWAASKNICNIEHSDERPAPIIVEYVPVMGEGKARELGFARSSAIWPEATDEQLCQDSATLKAALLARLPDLMLRFKAEVESLGFTY